MIVHFELMLLLDHQEQLKPKDFEINVNTYLFLIQKIFKKYFLADFESRDGRRHPSGNNRSNDGYRQGGRPGNNYNQQETSENAEDGYNDGIK